MNLILVQNEHWTDVLDMRVEWMQRCVHGVRESNGMVTCPGEWFKVLYGSNAMEAEWLMMAW